MWLNARRDQNYSLSSNHSERSSTNSYSPAIHVSTTLQECDLKIPGLSTICTNPAIRWWSGTYGQLTIIPTKTANKVCLVQRCGNVYQLYWCRATFLQDVFKKLFKIIFLNSQHNLLVTGHLSERSFVRNVVVQIPKFDAKPNPKPNPNLSPNPNPNPSPNPDSSPNPNPSASHNPMRIRFGQMTLQTSELLPNLFATLSKVLLYKCP